jgi:hypothetical protein
MTAKRLTPAVTCQMTPAWQNATGNARAMKGRPVFCHERSRHFLEFGVWPAPCFTNSLDPKLEPPRRTAMPEERRQQRQGQEEQQRQQDPRRETERQAQQSERQGGMNKEEREREKRRNQGQE